MLTSELIKSPPNRLLPKPNKSVSHILRYREENNFVFVFLLAVCLAGQFAY